MKSSIALMGCFAGLGGDDDYRGQYPETGQMLFDGSDGGRWLCERLDQAGSFDTIDNELD